MTCQRSTKPTAYQSARHVRVGDPRRTNKKGLLQCKRNNSDREEKCPTCFPVLRCTTCNLEFEIEIRHIASAN